MPSSSKRPRVLILAQDCNPHWPSLPVVGYKYARALSRLVPTTIVTHVRNRENIEAAGDAEMDVDYIDNEYLAAPLYRAAKWLRGGDQVAWSTNMMMAYPAYLEFERQLWRRYRDKLRDGAFDIAHRITPMSPTMPSYIAGRCPVPFVLGPLNGNLDWPPHYRAEMAREKERARALRKLYKALPYSGSTVRRAACVLAGFRHTIADLERAPRERIVNFPEVGFDPEIFHPPEAEDRRARDDHRLEFLYAGRLVPYKLPEAALRAFAASPALRRHRLRIVGDGPERQRLEALAAEHDLGDGVVFEGAVPQAEVAAIMRRSDVFVFPSIRELGAGVVVEAMASELACIVVDYGAPGDLVDETRGYKTPMGSLEAVTDGLRARMEACAADPEDMRARAARARDYAFEKYVWDVKAELTLEIYDWTLGHRPDRPAPYGDH